jgi:hypothetical protein
MRPIHIIDNSAYSCVLDTLTFVIDQEQLHLSLTLVQWWTLSPSKQTQAARRVRCERAVWSLPTTTRGQFLPLLGGFLDQFRYVDSFVVWLFPTSMHKAPTISSIALSLTLAISLRNCIWILHSFLTLHTVPISRSRFSNVRLHQRTRL